MKNVLLLLGYLAAAVVIVGGTVLLVAYGEGYRYDLKTQSIVRNGLILVDSAPGGARVTLDGKATKRSTPYRKSIITGSYTLKLERQGYRTWERRFDVTATEVSSAEYVRLVVETPSTTTLATHTAGINLLTSSTDRRHMAYVVPTGADAGVWWIDTTGNSPRKLYGAQPNEVFGELSLTDDGQRLLVRVGGPTPRYLVLSASGDAPVDIAATFGPGVDALRMNPANWRELYWLSAENLRRLNLSDRTTSAVLADRVVAYEQVDDRIAFVQRAVDPAVPVASLWLLERGGRTQQVDAALPPSQSYGIDYATYRGSNQLAIAMPTVQTTKLYRDVLNDERRVTTALASGDASRLSFNDNGRYMALIGTQVSIYDWDKGLPKPLVAPLVAAGFSWYDGFHALGARNNSAVFAEYDGNYQHELGAVAGQAYVGGQDALDIVSVTPPSEGTTNQRLIRTRIRER